MHYPNEVGIIPLTDAAGITQEFVPGKHYGIDIGWSSVAAEPNCEVLAWQDGVVVDAGKGSEVGNYLVIEHDYPDVQGHRWTAYIHLQSLPSLKKGDKVYFGKPMGNARRGNSGDSGGVHLHFYLTKIVSRITKYTWGTMKSNCIDPKPFMYYSKEYNKLYISPTSWKKPLPAPLPDVVDPVERDPHADQIICHDDDLRVRMKPSLTGTVLGHLLKDKYYNYYEMIRADGYDWYRIADDQWCAKVDSLEVLPKEPEGIKLEIGDRLEVMEITEGTITFKIRKE